MKRLFSLLSLLLIVLSMSAQTKILERSAKKTPTWLNTAVDGGFAVTVQANNLADAQVKAMAEVTERIILSVASNVSVTQRNVSSEVVTNDNVDSRDEFSRLSKIKSANLPFLKGISQNKVSEVYWVHVRDKQTGKEYYEYSVLYPYTRAEQRSLQAQFEELDAKKTAEYAQLEAGIDDINDVDEIKAAITSLQALKEYFFDDVRVKQTEGLEKRYRQLYDALSLTGKFVKDGEYLCQVLLKGKPVRVSKMPTVKSNCASQIAVKPADGHFVINYDASDCLPEEENFLDIQFRIEGKQLRQKAFLAEGTQATADSQLSLAPEGKVVLTAALVDTSARTLTNINIRLSVNNRNGTTFGLKSIELEVPELTSPLVFDDIDAVYSTKGLIQIKALAQGEASVRNVKKSNFSFVTGYMTVVNPNTNAVEKIKISLPYTTNW